MIIDGINPYQHKRAQEIEMERRLPPLNDCPEL